jgi:hypothetical protein
MLTCEGVLTVYRRAQLQIAWVQEVQRQDTALLLPPSRQPREVVLMHSCHECCRLGSASRLGHRGDAQ